MGKVLNEASEDIEKTTSLAMLEDLTQAGKNATAEFRDDALRESVAKRLGKKPKDVTEDEIADYVIKLAEERVRLREVIEEAENKK